MPRDVKRDRASRDDDDRKSRGFRSKEQRSQHPAVVGNVECDLAAFVDTNFGRRIAPGDDDGREIDDGGVRVARRREVASQRGQSLGVLLKQACMLGERGSERLTRERERCGKRDRPGGERGDALREGNGHRATSGKVVAVRVSGRMRV